MRLLGDLRHDATLESKQIKEPKRGRSEDGGGLRE
jgi:hypothetical protein